MQDDRWGDSNKPREEPTERSLSYERGCRLTHAHGALDLSGPTRVMGILNITPDSFSDGGKYVDQQEAVDHALRMEHEGAAVIDVGGESSRPGSERVSSVQQRRRVVPVIEKLADMLTVPISIDTTSAEVAMAAIDAGASIINDISAGQEDSEMFALAAGTRAGLILMHMQGEPGTMQKSPFYVDVVGEVRQYLDEVINRATAAGVSKDQIAVDPGIGFGKLLKHNLLLLGHLGRLHELGVPVLVGPSRKAFIGQLTGREPDERLAGTLAAVASCVAQDVQLVRVHDVGQACDLIAVLEAIHHSRAENTELDFN